VSGDAFREAIIEVVRADRWRSDCGEGTADAILAHLKATGALAEAELLIETERLLAEVERLQAERNALLGAGLQLRADLAAERAEVERLRAALQLPNDPESALDGESDFEQGYYHGYVAAMRQVKALLHPKAN